MGIESAAAAIDFAGLIDEALRSKIGGEEFAAASARSSMASMSMKLLLPNAPAQLQSVVSPCGNLAADGGAVQPINRKDWSGCQLQRIVRLTAARAFTDHNALGYLD